MDFRDERVNAATQLCLCLCLCVALLVAGCSSPDGRADEHGASSLSATEGSASTSMDSAGSTTASGTISTTSTLDDGSNDDGLKFDIELPDTPHVDRCAASDLDQLRSGATPSCGRSAPPESFDPVEEWRYPPNHNSMHSWVTPLVVNFTDDNGDGVIDMCDMPDVILTAWEGNVFSTTGCAIHVIDGDFGNTGVVHHVFDQFSIHCTGNPAVGDIDNDGRPDIVAVSNNPQETLIAIGNDGNLLWESEPNPYPTGGQPWRSGAVALHDLNGDGNVEILYNHIVFDSNGMVLWAQPDPSGSMTWLQATTAADLDGDGDLEVLTAFSAHDFDGAWTPTLLWDLHAANVLPAFAVPHVANFDDDPEPEVLYTSDWGYFMVEHDGSYTWPNAIKPALQQPCNGSNWAGFMRAAAIHDYDNDGQAEFAVAACNVFAIYDVTAAGPVPIFQAIVQDFSGGTGTTAFDFLGDATPEPVYSDETIAWAWAHDGATWEPRLQLPRASPTYMEYPSVADIDNDGSAEILVPSADDNTPALVVFGDADDRWIQARRIYNQHAYSVTHVREDGTIPAQTLPNWHYFNTFRANSQIEGGSSCVPAG
jgi:hypothetical protein